MSLLFFCLKNQSTIKYCEKMSITLWDTICCTGSNEKKVDSVVGGAEMIIQHNLAAIFTQRQLGITEKGKADAANRLASGYKVNKAADNAAGLSISEKMRGQIRGLERASKNIQDGISYVQVADGAMNEVHSIMQRIRELAVQAANDTYVDVDREATDAEVQQLKEQIDCILEQTEFNTRPIWDVNTEERTLLGTEKRTAVTMAAGSNRSYTTNLTNDNKYLIADGYYTVHASEKGMQLTWTDYYGDTHKVPANVSGEEQYVPLPQPNAEEHPDFPGERFLPQKYTVNFTDYMSPADKSLGIQLPMSFNIADGCTLSDVIASLDGTRFYQSTPTSFAIETGGSTASGISLHSGYFNDYDKMLALDSLDSDSGSNVLSGVDFSRVDDAFLEATSAANVTKPDFDTMTGIWSMTFENPNYPGVTFTAVSDNSVSFSCNSREPEHKGTWWDEGRYDDGRKYTYGMGYSVSEGSTLASIEEALTGSLNLITGDTDNSGNGHTGEIQVRFQLTADQPIYITKPDGSKVDVGTNIGYFYMDISVEPNDTVNDLVDRIKTLDYIDIKSMGAEPDGYTYFNGPKEKSFDAPLWKAVNKMNVQAGANERQNILLAYEALRTYSMGMTNTNVLTRLDAGSAITEVDEAMEILSQQRSYFGAIQNRLEHAQLNADNTGENLQASESRIRDADIPEEMVELSKLTILEQAAQAVMAQENKATEGVLKLLQ